MDKSEPKKPRALGSRETLLSSRAEYAAVGVWLRQYREKQGLGQRELSALLGKAVTYVHKIEAGKQRIDVVEFYDLMSRLTGTNDESIETFMERFKS